MSDIYAIAYPPQKEHTTSAPVLLMLHGFGSNEHDLMGLAPYLDERLHMVSARATYDVGFGYAWYYLYGVPGNLQHDDASRSQSLDILTQFVTELPSRIDGGNGVARKIYLLGFSQGAVMSLNLALKSPHLVAGVVAISGYLDEQVAELVAPDTVRDLPFLVMHGTMDELIPVERGRRVREFLQTTPANLEYHEYPVGHSIHPQALDVMKQWLGKQIDRDKTNVETTT